MSTAELLHGAVLDKTDGVPSTQELLQDQNNSYLKEITRPKHADVDLVAVHGLNWADAPAFAVKTWVGGESGAGRLWLKDFLPHRLPNVRVLLFAYNSNVAFQTSKIGVGDIAEDLLHKLWTFRQAVVKARIIPRYLPISKSAKSFAFFATPHHGGFGAEVGQAAAGLIRRLGRNPRTGIMEALRKDSLIAPDIHSDFVDGQDNYHICSFYECRPTPGLSSLIVEKSSAILHLGPAEIRVPCTGADHSTICKFPCENEHYRYVIDEIEDLVDWAIKSARDLPLSRVLSSSASSASLREKVNSSQSARSFPDHDVFPPSFPAMNDVETSDSTLDLKIPDLLKLNIRRGPFFLVPYSENFNFVGQQEALHCLKEMSTQPSKSPNNVALCGLGGIGKSQIALAYAYWHQRNFEKHSIFWLHAGDYLQLQESLELVAAHCRVSRTEDTKVALLDRLKLWLSDPTNGPWLMIIDSADRRDTFTQALENTQWHTSQRDHSTTPSRRIGRYFAAPAHGTYLFTTNNLSTAETLVQPQHIIHVHSMKPQDASTLLRSQLARIVTQRGDAEVHKVTWQEKELQKLAEKLDYIPLALLQAAAFIRQNSFSVPDYLKVLDDNESELTKLLEHELGSEHERDDMAKAVMSTWKAAIDEIHVHCPAAVEIISLIAFYDVQHIPKSLLRQFHNNMQYTDEALRILIEYSFITASTSTESFEMHRLVQLAMRKRLAVSNVEKEWAVKALSLLSQHFPDGKYESWDMCALLCPHALKVIQNTLYSTSEALSLGSLQSKLSWYFAQRGSYKQAELHNRRALELMVPIFGVNREHICTIKFQRIVILQKLNILEEAEDLAQEVWKERRETLGVRHKETLRSLALLCVIYQEQGRYVEGEKSLRKINKSLEETVEANDLTLLAPKYRLGFILLYLGRYDEALKWLRDAAILHETHLGPRHPQTLKINYGLARTLYQQGKYPEAEKMNLDTWAVQKEVLGTEHPDTLKSRHEVALNQQAQHNFAAAELSLRELYQQATSIVGSSHRYTYTVASSLASCLVAASSSSDPLRNNRLAAAESFYQLSLRGWEHDLLPSHPSLLAARSDLHAVRRLRHSMPLPAIEAAERACLKKLKAVLDREHPFAVKSRENLARTLWAQRDEASKRKEALVQAKKVLEVREKRLGWLMEGGLVREETLKAAELMLEMLPEGRERVRLEQKMGGMRYAWEFRKG
ncbi:hypothetical protein MMC13_002478 [Lambiella insularis]|nr:hypothetical protein [Lambiella insularis]